MRRLYNEGQIRKLAQSGQYNEKIKYGKPLVRGTRRIPAGSRSKKTRYFDKISRIQIANLHCYVSPIDKRIGDLDPKSLLIDGTKYYFAEGQPEPARIGNKEINRILGKTGVRAMTTYLYHVSEQTQKLWKEQVRNRLERIGVLEKREWVVFSVVQYSI